MYLLPGAPPPPPPVQSPTDWTPYRDRVDFELTEFLYKTVQMSGGSIDTLSQLIRATVIAHGIGPDDIDLFACNNDLLGTIDTTLVGDVPWQGFSMFYEGPRPDEVPEWMTTTYDVWHRDPRSARLKSTRMPGRTRVTGRTSSSHVLVILGLPVSLSEI